MGAMIASCAERGFEATTVAHLLELAGTSRAAFYEHFENKLDCFTAMLEEVVERALSTLDREQDGGGAGTVEGPLTIAAKLIAAQPATARVCMIEAFAAGPDARATVDRAARHFEGLIASSVGAPARDQPMPAELVRAMAGGAYKVFQSRVSRGQAGELAGLVPPLAEWMRSQEPPPVPLQLTRRIAVASPFSSTFFQQDPVEKILRAVATCVAEHSYPATTIAQIAASGHLSQRTFYEHFAGKEEATIAVLDSSGAQMLAAAMPAVRRAPDWPSAVHNAYAAMCGFMAAEPDFARLRAVEVYSAGSAAVEVRDRAGLELLEGLLELAPEEIKAKADPLLLEAIAGSVYALLYDCVRESGPQEVPRVVPFTTYLTLAPFIGAEQACRTANGDGRRSSKSPV